MTETVNIEQRNSQAASAVVTAVGPVVVAAVGVNVAGRYLYQVTRRVPGSWSWFNGKRHLPGVQDESAHHAGVGARVSFF